MDDGQSLVTDLEDLFCELDKLVQRHREAEAYDRARERTEFLLARLQELLQSLDALYAICMDAVSRGGVDGQQLWRRTCAELRNSLPVVLAAPGRSLITGDVELLSMVSCLGGAQSLVRERHMLASAQRGQPNGTL